MSHSFDVDRTQLYDENGRQLYPMIFQPDYHFIGDRGFINFVNDAAGYKTPFERRLPMAFWRGAPHHKARMGICLLSRNYSWINAKISIDTEGLEPLNITGDRVDEKTWYGYRGIFDVDGFSNAWGLFWRLASGSVVFKIESTITNAYISKLQPWVHYIPIAEDLHDLYGRTRLILGSIDSPSAGSASGGGNSSTAAAELSRQAETLRVLKNITMNARKLAEEFSYEKEVKRVAYEISNYFEIFKPSEYSSNCTSSSGSRCGATNSSSSTLSVATTQSNSSAIAAVSSNTSSSSSPSFSSSLQSNGSKRLTGPYHGLFQNYNYVRLRELWGAALDT
jgi:hypothetical protein